MINGNYETGKISDNNFEVNPAPMINGTNLQFADISTEKYRTYVFPNGEVHIDKPTQLNVSKNGHRVFDSRGVSHYIPQGWIHLKWEAKDGAANFVK